jgi:hypothetical protein
VSPPPLDRWLADLSLVGITQQRFYGEPWAAGGKKGEEWMDIFPE